MRICVALAFLSACAGFGTPVEKPTVDVRGVSVESINMSSLSGHVDLDVFNPNSFGVPLRSGTWTISVGGNEAVSGQFDLSNAIPAKATAPVRASLHLDAADALAVGGAITRGERRYVLSGTLHFETKLGPVDVDYQHEGDLTDATGSKSPLSLFGSR
jgi:LEA14-like dessication related protein